MKVELQEHTCIVQREEGDPRVYKESLLWYHIRRALQEQGYDVIKKLMWKDGHLVDDHQYYVRTRRGFTPSFMVWDPDYAIRFLHKPYNEMCELHLRVTTAIWRED